MKIKCRPGEKTPQRFSNSCRNFPTETNGSGDSSNLRRYVTHAEIHAEAYH